MAKLCRGRQISNRMQMSRCTGILGNAMDYSSGPGPISIEQCQGIEKLTLTERAREHRMPVFEEQLHEPRDERSGEARREFQVVGHTSTVARRRHDALMPPRLH